MTNIDWDDPDFQRAATQASAPQAYDQETPAELAAEPDGEE